MWRELRSAVTGRTDRVRRTVSELRGEGPGARLVQGGTSTLAVRVVGMALVFGNQVLLARLLEVENYGRYIYVISWLNLVVIVAVAGIDKAAVKFIAGYVALEDWSKLKGSVSRAFQGSLITSTCLAAVSATAVWLIRHRIDADLAHGFWLGCLLLPVLTYLRTGSGVLRGLGRIAVSRVPDDIVRPLLLAAGVVALYTAGAHPVSATLTVSANLFASVVAVVVLVAMIRQAVPKTAVDVPPEYDTREWARVAGPLLLMAGIQVVLSQTDTLMLGALAGTTDAGIYAVACRLAVLTVFSLEIVNLVAAPLISGYHAVADRRRLQRLVAVSVRAAFLSTVPIAGILVLGGRSLLSIFGDEFVAGYAPLVVLCCAYLFNCLCGSVALILIMTGHERRAASVMGGVALLNVVLNAILIPMYGMMGAAIATSVSMVIWNVVLLRDVIRIHGLNPSILPWRPSE